MANIFISYRRVDSEGYVGRLYDHLLQYFNEREIFRDLDTIKPGEDFVTAIERVIGTCDALIAIIGPQWLNIRDQNGTRRLDNPKDYVRLEVATALRRNILVLPVLVAKATMPSKNDLPSDLSDLSRRNAIELSNDRFAFDVERIAHAIGGYYGQLEVKAGFRDLGSILVYDDRKNIGTMDLLKSTKPLRIQVEKGTHTIYVCYVSMFIFPGINSNALTLNVKIGQTQSITVEREMILPAQYKTHKLPSGRKNQFLEWNEQVSLPTYRIVIKPY